MTTAYQRFLDFFSLAGTARLDGLDSSYFDAMTRDERSRAYDFLLARVEKGGTGESINGLFLADPDRAAVDVTSLLAAGRLRPEAEILGAWNIYRLTGDVAMMTYFAKLMRDSSAELRGNAAYWVPTSAPTRALLESLEGMVLAETEKLPRIHAVNKLLEFHGVTRALVDRKEYTAYYRALWSDDAALMETTFASLDEKYPVSFVDH